MSQIYKKSAPLPVDPESERQEAVRREALVCNSSHNARLIAARALEISNRSGELTGAIEDLRRMKVAAGRANFAASVNGYNRVYDRIRRLALVIAGSTGEPVTVPAYDPPGERASQTEIIKPPASTVQMVVRDDLTEVAVDMAGAYRESKGRSPDGTGLPLRGPGSNVDPDWNPK